jgi:hypothetical protein
LFNCSVSILIVETPGHSGWAETPRTDRGGADLIQVNVVQILIIFIEAIQ